jgi:hypothetical protein
MASIADLCWTTTEDLFRDVDLDDLYMLQATTIAGSSHAGHPYLVLVHTGKITIAIHLGRCSDHFQGQTGQLWEDRQSFGTGLFAMSPLKEPPE